MVDEAKMRAALQQEADTVELPDGVWAKVRAARPERRCPWGRIRMGHVMEAVAVCAVLVGLVGVGALRANHAQQTPAGKHQAAATLPATLDVKTIKSAEVQTLPPLSQSVAVRPEYLAKIVTVYNQDPKQIRSRGTAATPDFLIVIHLTSGQVLSLGVAKEQSISADYDGAAFWVDSRGLSDVLRGADSLLRRGDVPPVTTGALFDPAVMSKVTAVAIHRAGGAQKTTTDPTLIAGVKAALANATFVTGEQNPPGLVGDPVSVTMRSESGDFISLDYYTGSTPPLLRTGARAGWWTAPALNAALTPLMPPVYLRSEQVLEIARKSDPAIRWVTRYEAKGSFAVDGDLVWVAVGLNSRDERVALYLDPVSGKILRADPPEAAGAKAVEAVKQFYALTARGDYKSVWDLLHAEARNPNPYLTPAMIQQRLAAMQGKTGPNLVSATSDKMSLDYSKYSNCMCLIADAIQVTAKLSDGSEARLMVAREPDGVWRILWAP